jgi:hypothetical protein
MATLLPPPEITFARPGWIASTDGQYTAAPPPRREPARRPEPNPRVYGSRIRPGRHAGGWRPRKARNRK